MPKSSVSVPDDPFADLSWDDLEQWVGSRSVERGRAYQKRGRVLALARMSDGALAGRVAGTGLYTTYVSRDAEAGRLSSDCSCPLGGHCKHAVAVVLEYLERRKAGTEIPSKLPSLPEDDLDADPDELDEDDFDAEEDADEAGPVDVSEYLEGLTAPELIELVHQLTAASDDALRVLETRVSLASGEAGAVAAAAREELRRVASEIGWQNHWNDQGHTPDYGAVASYVRELLAAGQADLVLDLGREIVKLGTRQVEQCDDEGETACEIAEALEPVWEALGRSSLTSAGRILWVYDRYASDEYDLCSGATETDIWDVDRTVWSEVADTLAARLERQDVTGLQAKDGWSLRYRRGNLAARAIHALQEAGRMPEAVELAVSEAPVTDSYDRAVGLLLEANRLEEAKALALEGIRQTESTYPGISAQLRTRLRELAARDDDHALAAGFTAEEFEDRPSLAGYCNLREAAEQAGVWPQVRDGVLRALETGSAAATHTDWPLPQTGTAPGPKGQQAGPHWALLTEIALDEGDHARALECYRLSAADRPLWGGGRLPEKVAREVAATHPDESLAIWRDLAERAIAGGNRRAYESSLQYLRPMQSLLESLGRGEEWSAYLAQLRTENRRRRALLETLDRLRQCPIMDER